jgi:hypothetical protein
MDITHLSKLVTAHSLQHPVFVRNSPIDEEQCRWSL